MHRAIKSNYEFSLWKADDTEVVTSQLCVHVKTFQIVKLVHTHMTQGVKVPLQNHLSFETKTHSMPTVSGG